MRRGSENYSERLVIEQSNIKKYNENLMYFKDVVNTSIIYPEGVSLVIKDKEIRAGNLKVVPNSTLQVAELFKGDVCVLNFASAKNAGGGWDRGMNSQEEHLCYDSNLYRHLQGVPEFYEYNKKHLNYGLYNDSMVYSKGVIVIRDQDSQRVLDVKDWYTMDVITSPAPNRQATRYRPEHDKLVPDIMKSRINKIVCVAILNNVKNLVLGAFGCGVFRNYPEVVSNCFKEVLIDDGLLKYFDNVVFAIPNGDSQNFVVFRDTLTNN